MKEDYKAMKKECKTAIKTYRLLKNEAENLRTKNKNISSELELTKAVLSDKEENLEKITKLYKDIIVMKLFLCNHLILLLCSKTKRIRNFFLIYQ